MSGADEIVLRDGGVLVARPIRREDAGALVALHARLSSDTIHRRYFGARPQLSPVDVERFTRVEQAWRFALVAVRRPAELVGVARYEGEPGGRSAEIAVVVDDAVQHQGLGRALLERLVDVAAERGLTTLVADVLVENSPMLGLLRTFGLPVRSAAAELGSRTLTVDLGSAELTEPRRARARSHIRAAVRGVPDTSAPTP